ncbi:hypothetical protein WA026_001549 [Henosepilachna vigintioctopunctata]|uniref:Uncharacterized protein n=1 Tax=Henosepilachna vigintioctopunctata TaxID=420089 RepID=A0AAW1UIL7_9CUCU
MEHQRSIRLLICIFCIYGALAIPSSMVEEIKARELKPNKVKRVSLPPQSPEENLKNGNHYYFNPSAIKRGAADWSPEEQNLYEPTDNDFQSSLYTDENSQDGKTLNEYEKGFQYGTNKEKLDEALENAVLKSEIYGGSPSSINRYRYLENDKKKRRKRDSRKSNYGNRATSDDLTPEEVLALLALYENERQPYQKPVEDLNDLEQDSDTWLDVPVRPHPELPTPSELGPAYLMDQNIPVFERSRWVENKDKRFMVSKRRNDPTRELRYLTGPSKHDYYTLSQLLSNQREANVPVFHRYIL